MEKWEKIQKNFKARELICIFGIIISSALAIICDVTNFNLILVDEIESYSLTILQIQATIGTLIFTIIALIAGNSSTSYMGVSISDFYLNIKPWILTQKRLIIISLGLCLSGVIAYSLGCHNLVFGLFISSLLAILISILDIYAAFEGNDKHKQEIEAYINYILFSRAKYEKKVNVFQNFVTDWEKIVASQDKQSYEKYLSVFRTCMIALWSYETDDALSVIEQQSYSVSYCLLGSEKKILKGRGLEFIQDIFDTLWNLICNNAEKEKLLNKYKREFHLFGQINNEVKQSIDEMDIEDVEKRLDNM